MIKFKQLEPEELEAFLKDQYFKATFESLDPKLKGMLQEKN
jgi:hypothetical protein